MPLGEEQSTFEVCCLRETVRTQGRESGDCRRDLLGDCTGRRQIAYRKRMSPQQAQGNLVCAMIPMRMSCAHLEWSRQSGDMNRSPRSIESATKQSLQESMVASNRLKEASETLSLPLKSG
jgi:hypothetical protein